MCGWPKAHWPPQAGQRCGPVLPVSDPRAQMASPMRVGWPDLRSRALLARSVRDVRWPSACAVSKAAVPRVRFRDRRNSSSGGSIRRISTSRWPRSRGSCEDRLSVQGARVSPAPASTYACGTPRARRPSRGRRFPSNAQRVRARNTVRRTGPSLSRTPPGWTLRSRRLSLGPPGTLTIRLPHDTQPSMATRMRPAAGRSSTYRGKRRGAECRRHRSFTRPRTGSSFPSSILTEHVNLDEAPFGRVY
jgi:hypothetical protein